MTTRTRKRRRHLGQLGPRRRPLDGEELLSAGQLDGLWAAYMADRSDLQLRNRLIEHYLPPVRQFAVALAKTLRLRDKENAVGEALAALVGSIVPDYDGSGSFEGWARVCLRRLLISLKRTERKAGMVGGGRSGNPGLDLLPLRSQRGGDLNFLEFTANLSDQQAIVLWMRCYRGMTLKAVAGLLKISPSSANFWTKTAVAALQNQWANCSIDDLPAY